MRSRFAIVIGAIAFSVSALLEIVHYFDLLDKFLGQGMTAWVTQGKIFLLMLVALLMFWFAWAEHKSEAHRNRASEGTIAPATPQPGAITTQTQQANPVTSQTVEIHNYPAVPSVQEQVAAMTLRHNVQFLGLKLTKTVDLQREVPMSEDGFWTVKATFINQSIPGVKVDDYDYVRARVVFTDFGGREVLSLSKPIWLDHEITDHIHLEVNSHICLLLAVFGNDNIWAAPFITKRPPEYWQDGEQLMIDGRPLLSGIGALQVEITLVDGNGVGLEPFRSVFTLGGEGTVTF